MEKKILMMLEKKWQKCHRIKINLQSIKCSSWFKIKNVFCLPGVPSILKSMMPNLKNYLIKGTVIVKLLVLNS